MSYMYVHVLNFLDELRYNQYGKLFKPESMISGKEDAANIYGRGYYTVGREMLHEVVEQIRKEVALCDNVSGFFIFHSMGGGTGSGFTSLLLNKLTEVYPKKIKLEFVIYPCPRVSIFPSKATSPKRRLGAIRVQSIAMICSYLPESSSRTTPY